MMDDSFSILQKSINFSMTSLLTTGGIRGNNGQSINFFQDLLIWVLGGKILTVGGFF